ncbi:MAG: glycoside hydrolase family 3 N-terminal domain-containing protein [Pseudomonadota bacterium]
MNGDPLGRDLASARAGSTPAAFITGLSGPVLTAAEAQFLRDADPWGLILFARNVETPEQVARLVADARAALGRNTPCLIDQEGGRVARLRPPHWLGWPPVRETVEHLGPQRAAYALELRFRLIASELRDAGIDVDCMPLLDVPQPGAHEIIGNRALGEDPALVAALGAAVCQGLRAGGVLPVIKHLPGHGRAGVDSHAGLPVVTASREALETDFAAFRPLAHEALGMTAHIVFTEIDPDACATLSPKAIRLIRQDIGFDGCLMTDDLSMQALSGPMRARAENAVAAGCDLVLHCNGKLEEMETVAAGVPRLAGEAQRRAHAAEAARSAAGPFDAAAALAEYRAMTGEPA